MTRNFDLIVIGSGVSGSTVAKECRAAGWEVAIIDALPFGGTCALRGCTPKKVLVDVAELIDRDRRLHNKGISYQDLQINWQELINFKKTFTEPVPPKREQEYADAGISMFNGTACFIDETTIQVNDETLNGRYILIATGAKPLTLNIPGEEYLATSDDFLELEELPPEIIFVGGGYISFESAHICARAGAKVQIFETGDRPLEHFDPDLVEKLVQASKDIGINIRVNTKVKAIEKSKDKFFVHVDEQNGEQVYAANLVLHGASRAANLDDLNLEVAGVKREKKGVSVSEYLQSISNPAVYAAGDCAATGAPQLTPVANLEAKVIVHNLLNGNTKKLEYPQIPSVVFTTPTLALVGYTEAQAQEKELKFRTSYHDTSEWLSSRHENLKYSAAKILIEEETNRILGAHILGTTAPEIINVFATAMKANLKADDLKEIIYAYPTGASDISKML